MGMDAELLAIGKFSIGIAKFLDYPGSFYENILEGAEIITGVCNCVTSIGSEQLAEALGISPWKFDEHCGIIGANADLDKMREAVEQPKQIDNFIALREAGFKFYYLPNG